MSKTSINKPTEYSLIDNNKKYLPSQFVFVPTICLTSNSETIGNAITEQKYYNVENDDFVCKITHKAPSEPSSRIVCKTDENDVYVYKYKNSDGNIEYVACLSKNLELDDVLIGQNFNATNVTVKMSYDGQDVALSYFYDTSGDESLKHTRTDNGNIPYIQVPNNYDNLEINTNNIFYKDEKTGNKKTYVIIELTENSMVKVITNLSKKDSVLTENEDGGYKINDLNITLRNTLKNEIDSGYLNYLFVMEGYYVAKNFDKTLTLGNYKEMENISTYVNEGFNNIENKSTEYNVWSCIDEVTRILENNIIKDYPNKDAFGTLTSVLDDLGNFKLAKKDWNPVNETLQNAQNHLDNALNKYPKDTDLKFVQSTLQASISSSSIQQFCTLVSTIEDKLQNAQSHLDTALNKYPEDTDLSTAKNELNNAQNNLQSTLEKIQPNLKNAIIPAGGNKPQFLANIELLKNWFGKNKNTLFSIYSEDNFIGNVHKSEDGKISAYWNNEPVLDNKTKQICNNFEKSLFYLDTEKNMIVAENDGNCDLVYKENDGTNGKILSDEDSFVSSNPDS